MRIVLAYAGSLAGSAAIQWLRERYEAEVVAVILDLGQGRELEAVRDRALTLGAQRAHVIDARDSFARDFVLPALRADALHEGRVPMALALSRPLIARTVVELAGIERADAVAHTGRAAAHVSRLDLLLSALAPALRVLRPARDWALDAAALSAFGRRHGLSASPGDSSQVESNFWGRSRRPGAGGEAVDDLVPSSHAAPDEPASVDISFTRGVPTALNGVGLPLLELVSSLGMLASMHGVAPVRVGAVSCDAPAAVLIHAAHRALTAVASPAEVQAFSAAASATYVKTVEEARWFSPLREGLDAYFAVTQAAVSGHVGLRIFKGEFSTTTTELSQPSAQVPLLRVVPSHAQH